MKLNTYLKNKSQAEFAGLVGVTPSMISYLLAGKRKASHELAKRIERATSGEVTRADVRPDIYS